MAAFRGLDEGPVISLNPGARLNPLGALAALPLPSGIQATSSANPWRKPAAATTDPPTFR